MSNVESKKGELIKIPYEEKPILGVVVYNEKLNPLPIRADLAGVESSVVFRGRKLSPIFENTTGEVSTRIELSDVYVPWQEHRTLSWQLAYLQYQYDNLVNQITADGQNEVVGHGKIVPARQEGQ